MGVSLPGHRKRLIQASMSLVPAPRSTPSMTEASTSSPMDTESTVSAPDAPDEPWETRRFNSTSSLYINSTITRPDTDEIICCVSEENNPLYAEPKSAPSADEVAKRARREVPSEETIFHTIRSVFKRARLPSECLIIGLIYMERLVTSADMPILVTSWRPILPASLILAQKVWDDRSLHNIDFSVLCPMFTLREIHHLEKKFLELLDYDVSICTSLYASYYFQLRTLCQREKRAFSLQPMDGSVAAKLEARGLSYSVKFKSEVNKVHMSADDIDVKRSMSTGLVGMRGLDK